MDEPSAVKKPVQPTREELLTDKIDLVRKIHKVVHGEAALFKVTMKESVPWITWKDQGGVHFATLSGFVDVLRHELQALTYQVRSLYC